MILHTKHIMPELPLKLIQRSALIEKRIRQNTKAIILTAPAGYGKTTTLQQWLRRKNYHLV